MLMKKAWIFTKKGVSLTKKSVAAVSIGFFCYEVFPNTILLPFKRERQEESMKARTGLPDLPYQVQEYVRQAIDDMKFTEKQRKGLSVYLTNSYEIETLGNVNSPFGALVKLPWALWSHHPIPETVEGAGVNNHPEASKQYLESLQWSDKAKLFIAAYQLAWTTRFQFLEHGVTNVVAIFCAFVAFYTVTYSKYAITDHFRTLVAFNFLLLLFFYVSWSLVTDVTTCNNEHQIITEVCSLGPDYAEGAVELYKKLKQHNIAIREMTGFVGRLKFDENGTTKSVRRITLPLNERLELAEECLKKYRKESGILDVKAK